MSSLCDDRASEHMYDILADVMKQPTTNNAAYGMFCLLVFCFFR